MNNISEHITYKEATQSQTAIIKGLANVPDAVQLSNMKHLAENVFEPLRKHFGKPIFVSSFFRAPLVNAAVGGAKKSQHITGEAMDLDGDIYRSPSNIEIFDYINGNLKFDQLIIEGISGGKIAWIHVSLRKAYNRGEKLIMYRKDGRTIYEPFTVGRLTHLLATI